MKVNCPKCRGLGFISKYSENLDSVGSQTCPTCHGAKVILLEKEKKMKKLKVFEVHAMETVKEVRFFDNEDKILVITTSGIYVVDISSPQKEE